MHGNWYNANDFSAFFDNNGNIFTYDYSGQKKVGVTLAKYNQLEKIANEAMGKAEAYFKTLEEHGLIQRELTADEKITALSGQVDQLTQLVAQLVSKEHGLQSQKKNIKAVTPEVLPSEDVKKKGE